MSNALLTIAYAQVPGFPAGTVVDHTEVTLTGPTTVSQAVPPGITTATFTGLAPGVYIFNVFGVDASGKTLGTPVTGTFTVAAATISVSLPISVTASLS